MLVELGPGTNPHPKATVGIDLHHPIKAPSQNAAQTPWEVFPASYAEAVNEDGLPMRIKSGTADEVYCSHFMEHVHRGQPLINVMNEAWRVLKPGGTFTMILPLVGYTDPFSGEPRSNHIGWQPWADPTHVNYWWFPEALWYFCEGPFKPHANYGIETWGPMGGWISEAEATQELSRSTGRSFWSVRSGWEGVARLLKP
jgi:SAM-dependent methyltransferase